jgi:outer membrane protein TolC
MFLSFLSCNRFIWALCLVVLVFFFPPASSAQNPLGEIPGQVPTSAQNPLYGSVPETAPNPTVLSLTFIDAVDRALRHNLSALLSEYNTIDARGRKWQELSDLLPNLTTDTQETAQKLSLIAEGFGKFPSGLFGGAKLPAIIGPFSYFDVRATATQRVFDWKSIQQYRAAVASENAAHFTLKNARELAVLVTGNAYLQALAFSARVETAQAQQDTAKALYEKAVAQQQAGVAPAIDTLRARVEYQFRRQQLIAATNDFAKQKLILARVIGLAPGQDFTLADKAPYEPFPIPDLETTLRRAYSLRSDYKAAQERVLAARLALNAASAGRFPTLDFEGDYGEIGAAPASVLPTYHVAGTLKIPIFQGGKVHADVLKAEAALRQAEAQLADVRALIDQDIRNSLLDLKSSAEQVEVAQSSVDLAEETLAQSRDRFSAGVTDNLEVVQAQQAVAAAHESLISSLYFNNVAKVAYARALGHAEDGVREYLRGK